MYDNSTPFSHLAGPFLTSDGNLSTDLSITTNNLLISVNGSSLSPWDAGPSSGDADGYHTLTITTLDLGANAAVLRLVINESSGNIMPWSTFILLEGPIAYENRVGVVDFPRVDVQQMHALDSPTSLLIDYLNGVQLSTVPKVEMVSASTLALVDANVIQMSGNSLASAGGSAFRDFWEGISTDDAGTLSSKMVLAFVDGSSDALIPADIITVKGSTQAGANIQSWYEEMGTSVGAGDLSSLMVDFFNGVELSSMPHVDSQMIRGSAQAASILRDFYTNITSDQAVELSSLMVDWFSGAALSTLPKVNIEAINNSTAAPAPMQNFWENLTTQGALDVSTLLPDFLSGVQLSTMPKVNLEAILDTTQSVLNLFNYWQPLTTDDATALSSNMVAFFEGSTLATLPAVNTHQWLGQENAVARQAAWAMGLGSTGAAEDLSSQMVNYFNGVPLSTLPKVDTAQYDGSSAAAKAAQEYWANVTTVHATSLANQMVTYFDGGNLLTSDLNQAFDDRGFTTAMSELATDPGNTPMPGDALMLLYHSLYHGQEASSVERRIKNSLGSFLTGTVSFDGSTFDQGALSTP